MKSVLLACVVLAFVVAAVGVSISHAIPAFTRKYETSCSTCHTAYPKLNAFGRAFMVNGYQFPGGVEADKEQTKEEPVSMGAEAYKRIWPDAIWPNSLPASTPLAIVVEAETAYKPDAPEGEPKMVFDEIPSEVEVLSGGNFGDNISFFAELEIKGGEAELEMAHVSFDNILPDHGLSFRIGKMVPYVTPFSHMRRLTAKYWHATKPLGDNQWNLDRTQRGFEARGVLAEGRLAYSAGLVEGRTNEPNGDKDFYLHLGYKVGGMRLDGVSEAESSSSSEPWRDDSVRFDGFYYNGRATLTGGQEDSFSQVGGSLDLYWDRLNVSVLLAIQNDDRPVSGQAFDGTGTHFMAEGTYVLYPWLLPNLRYEWFKSELGDHSETEQRVVPGLVALIRANVKATLLAEIEKGAEEEEFEIEETEFALVFGF